MDQAASPRGVSEEEAAAAEEVAEVPLVEEAEALATEVAAGALEVVEEAAAVVDSTVIQAEAVGEEVEEDGKLDIVNKICLKHAREKGRHE